LRICATGKFPDFRKEVIILDEIFKVFLHPPPPSERESFVKVLGLIILKMNLLSIPKMRL
jgi:hypothetical protein